MSESNELAKSQAQPPALLRPVAPVAAVIQAQKEAVEFIKEALEPGRDYGTIPGTDKKKKNLLKPGAERLAIGFGLVASYEIMSQEVDHCYAFDYSLVKWVERPKPDKAREAEMKAAGHGRNAKFDNQWKWQERDDERGTAVGLYRYVIVCKIHAGDRLVGEGVGACSTMETKYIRTPRDAENTVLKMAKKRAFIDGILTVLGLSDRFSQDLEDIAQNTAARAAPPESAAAEIVDAELVDDEPKSWLTLDRTANAAEQTEATDYMKAIGMGRDLYAALKAASGGIDPRFVLLEGKRLSLTKPVDVIRLVDETYGVAEGAESVGRYATPPAEAPPTGTPPTEPAAPAPAAGEPAADPFVAPIPEMSSGWRPKAAPAAAKMTKAASEKEKTDIEVLLDLKDLPLKSGDVLRKWVWRSLGYPEAYVDGAAAYGLLAEFLNETSSDRLQAILAALGEGEEQPALV